MDNLIQSPISDSNACYVNKISDGVDSYMDFGSGFTTTTLMTEGSEIVKTTIETSPELFKDLRKVDNEGRVWFPATITIPGNGMVFADGTDKDDWEALGVLSVPVSELKKLYADDNFNEMPPELRAFKYATKIVNNKIVPIWTNEEDEIVLIKAFVDQKINENIRSMLGPEKSRDEVTREQGMKHNYMMYSEESDAIKLGGIKPRN